MFAIIDRRKSVRAYLRSVCFRDKFVFTDILSSKERNSVDRIHLTATFRMALVVALVTWWSLLMWWSMSSCIQVTSFFRVIGLLNFDLFIYF